MPIMPTPLYLKPLTAAACAPYHSSMAPRLPVSRRILLVWSAALLGTVIFYSAPAHARPGDKKKDKTPNAAPQEVPPLPLYNPSRRITVSLLSTKSDIHQALLRKVEEKFASGEQNYKAGHLESA